jgi:putative phage-type endonuclease
MAATAEYLSVVQRTPEWIEARQHGIGASEAAAACGLSPWESPYSLWARKCGLVPPIDTTLAMEIGTLTEPLNAARYADAVGMPVRRVNRLMRSKSRPFALASLDRRRADGRLVELKWSERADGYGDPGTDEVPEAVACQVTHQMFVAGADCADVSLLTGARDAIRVYTVRWDAEFADAMLEREARLWGHVEDRTEPELDGSAATLRALSERYPAAELEEVESADPDVAEALRAVLDVREAIARHQSTEKTLRVVLEAAQGAAGLLTVPGVGSVRWAGWVKGSTKWKDAAAALWGEIAAAESMEMAAKSLPEFAEQFRGEGRRGDWEPRRVKVEEGSNV